MSDIEVFIKEGSITKHTLHWREAMSFLQKQTKGVPTQFLFIDKDARHIVSSQDCFQFIDLSPLALGSLLEEFTIEEL